MIHINKISETSLNKLKVCTRLIENEFLDNVYNEIVVFTDEVEIIRFNLKRILNICGIYINLQILPFSDRLNYKNKISECSSRFIRTPSQKYSDSLKVEIF